MPCRGGGHFFLCHKNSNTQKAAIPREVPFYVLPLRVCLDF